MTPFVGKLEQFSRQIHLDRAGFEDETEATARFLQLETIRSVNMVRLRDLITITISFSEH